MTKESAIWLIVPLSLFLLDAKGNCQDTASGDFFVDDFEDGDYTDFAPANWRRVGNFAARDSRIVNGDLLIEGISGFPSLAPTEDDGETFSSYVDFSLTTRGRILPGNQLAEFGVYGRRAAPGFAYFGVIDNSGLMYLGEFANGADVGSVQFQTDLRPREHDVILKMDFHGDQMSLSAWDATDGIPPATPMLTYQDDSLSTGAIAMVTAGSGDVAFRWFEVAPVPEPSSIQLAVIAMAPFLVTRQRKAN